MAIRQDTWIRRSSVSSPNNLVTERRRARLGEQLKRELSSAIRQHVRDPDVGPLTVTGVDVTADLWLARVYVQPLGSDDERARTLAGLERAAPFLRTTLGRSLHIRRMPELRFLADPSIDEGRRIEAILKDVLPEGGEDPNDPESTPSGP